METIIDSRYELRERLGSGASGETWAATDLRLDREVAVKFTGDAQLSEAYLAGRLSPPGIVPVYDAGASENGPYLVMALCPGGSLAERIVREGALPADEARRVMAAVARAVAFAHEGGVLHNDIKPANILFDSGGAPLLADFGPATRIPLETIPAAASAEFAGTLPYLAPEVIAGEPPSPRSDIYALGATLFECLAGTPPRPGGWLALPPDVDVTRELGDVLVHSLHPEPQRRFKSVDELIEALEPPPSPPAAVVVPPVSAPLPLAHPARRRHASLALAAATLASIALISVAFGLERGQRDDASALEDAGVGFDLATPTGAPVEPTVAVTPQPAPGAQIVDEEDDDSKPEPPGRAKKKDRDSDDD
ncbi:MAG TPA: serine/threonine-protein kinase [Tepidiformaceae bacterium]|nr:serine/threonine-protein kinase [Tepidiformaceae bacterium]